MGLTEMMVYSLVAALFGATVTLLVIHYRKQEMKPGKLAGVLVLWTLGLISVAFALDWAYACTLEVEPQSAAMGLLIFGGIGIILGVIGFRVGKMGEKEPSEKDPAETAPTAAELEAA